MAELNLDDLAVFVRVVDHGGFASAARELGEPTSTVSRAIARLEARSGVRLFHRTTRSLRPTTEGHELYASIAPAVTTLRGAAQALEPSTQRPKGRLRVTAPNDLCASFLSDVIVAFLERYPLVNLDFTLTNQHSNLVSEGFDVALRAAARLSDSSIVARKLGDLELRLYSSPRYARKYGTPGSPQDLHQHKCIVFRAAELVRTWALKSAAGGAPGDAELPIRGRIGGDDFSFIRSIIIAGGGIGILPHINAAADEANGRLVRVLPEYHLRGATLYILYPSTRNVPTRVTAFRDFVIEAFDAWSARRGGELRMAAADTAG
jgi:DNA-binding transcriptional LysR family regulator